MKIAYLITAHSDPKHLSKLICNINSSDVYVHIDKKNFKKFNGISFRNVRIYSTYSVSWGGFSFCESVLLLISEALKYNKYDYFVLLSGSDYPIKSKKYIESFFKKNSGKEYIGIKEMPTSDKPLSRLEKIYLEPKTSNKVLIFFYRALNLIFRVFPINRKLPKKYAKYKMYAGTTWWALSEGCIKYIISFISTNPGFCLYYKKTANADEMFFHTIIGNSKFATKVQNTLTYTDWSQGGAHPAHIGEHHLEIFKSQLNVKSKKNNERIYLFARKFRDNSAKVVDQISQLILNSEL